MRKQIEYLKLRPVVILWSIDINVSGKEVLYWNDDVNWQDRHKTA